MTTYNEITNNLLNDGAKEFYRFQGHKSFECFDIRNNRFNNTTDHYVYFSNSKNHHYYFTIKRIKQLINTIVLKDSNYQITRKQLDTPSSFKHIKNIVFNSDKIKNLNSISLICDPVYYALIKENCINNYAKTFESGIEKVDRKVYGGGYGITGPWLDLFNDLTYFSSYVRISSFDVVKLLNKMRRKSIQTNPLLIKDIIEAKQRNYNLSTNLYNDFHKYDIMNDLERICQEGLFLENSSLSKHPTKTIKQILNKYQGEREKILTAVNHKYHNL